MITNDRTAQLEHDLKRAKEALGFYTTQSHGSIARALLADFDKLDAARKATEDEYPIVIERHDLEWRGCGRCNQDRLCLHVSPGETYGLCAPCLRELSTQLSKIAHHSTINANAFHIRQDFKDFDSSRPIDLSLTADGLATANELMKAQERIAALEGQVHAIYRDEVAPMQKVIDAIHKKYCNGDGIDCEICYLKARSLQQVATHEADRVAEVFKRNLQINTAPAGMSKSEVDEVISPSADAFKKHEDQGLQLPDAFKKIWIKFETQGFQFTQGRQSVASRNASWERVDDIHFGFALGIQAAIEVCVEQKAYYADYYVGPKKLSAEKLTIINALDVVHSRLKELDYTGKE